jgi:hypothetical protein
MDMALYEDLGPDRPAGRPGQEPATPRLSETIRLGLVVLLVGLWIAGAYGGIVYWALQESVLGVLASTLVSLIAGAATWLLFIKLTEHEGG